MRKKKNKDKREKNDKVKLVKVNNQLKQISLYEKKLLNVFTSLNILGSWIIHNGM